MIEFVKNKKEIIFQYTTEIESNESWVLNELKNKGEVTFKKTFWFSKKELVATEPDKNELNDFNDEIWTTTLLFASKIGDYYKVKKGVLTKAFDIYIHKEIPINPALFITDGDVSIIKKIKPLLNSDLYIGGDHEGTIPWNIYQQLIHNFPNSYEKKTYVEARVSAVLSDYMDTLKDGEKAYHTYMNKKTINYKSKLKKTFKKLDLIKYQTLLDKLSNMLDNENSYSEKQWQEEILQILLLLYPKYISVFREVPIKDPTLDRKFLDYMLIDSSGYIDIIEIKRPFDKCIVTENRYRNNFIPLRELSGTIMQIEKYLFYLNRMGTAGEKALSAKYKNELPEGMDIKIINPGGIIIMGRETHLSLEQKADFEVVKRKYKNVFDIITYDNLIYRLSKTIEQIKKL